MQSILITSKNKKNSHKHAAWIASNNKIDNLDIDIVSFEKIIGIEDIRALQKRLFLKPIKGNVKAAIIEAYEGLTIEAQNALLKVLEEPPENTIIIVTIPNKNLLLPTILSRCKIIELKEEFKEPTEKEISQYLNILISLPKSSMGEKLKLAQDFGKSREDAIIWLEQMSVVVRKSLINSIKNNSSIRQEFSASGYLNILKLLEETYTAIKTTNVNQRFALENLFLSL